MGITTLAQYKAALTGPQQIIPFTIAATTSVVGRWYDLWRTAVPIGAAPTSAVVPTNTTLGSFGQLDSTAKTLSFVGTRFNSMSPGVYVICDRLSHQGGLSAVTTGAQTTNLPTAALTRYTSGEGVMIGLTVYTAIGATGTTITASYTDSGGTSGNTTPAVVFGGTGFREVNRMILLPLAAGDSGVQAVANVNIVATTGTAGNFGVTLFKPLFTVVVDDTSGVKNGGFISGGVPGGFPEVLNGACLFAIAMSTSTIIAGGGAFLIEEH